MTNNEPIKADVEQFATVEDAVASVQRERAFDDVAGPILQSYVDRQGEWTELLGFFQSAVTRARGLREAIVREIAQGNPHAVFTLLRQFAETIAVVFYVADHPRYVHAISTRPRDHKAGTPRRKSAQALADYMDKHHSQQFKVVYGELCEGTHFGSSAMWIAHSLVADDETQILHASWSSAPCWHRDRDAKLACAWTLELTGGMETALGALGKTLIASVTAVDDAREATR
jgi:hypothetical protein